MKNLLLFIILTFLSHIVFAKSDNPPIHLKLNLNYTKDDTNNFILKKNIEIKTDQRWVTVQNNTDPTKKDNMLLLIKAEKSDANTVNVSYVLLDTNANPDVVSQAKIIVAYGQEGKVAKREKNKKIQFGILATVQQINLFCDESGFQ